MKRAAAKITLVLAGAVLLHRSVQTRGVYPTRGDCVHDWSDERKCEAAGAGV